MSQTRQRRMSINSQQTIEEDAELNLTGYRLRNPSYKHSLKSMLDMDNTDVKMALKSVESGSEGEEENEEALDAGGDDIEGHLEKENG